MTASLSDHDALPLTGMKVLDLTRALSGPFCTSILGDLGADVIKVEPLPEGDMSREWGPFDREESVYYLSGNRNKRAIAVNFRADGSIELLREMILKSDVVVENFKPGTMVAIGLDPLELRKQEPGLIIASLSGFGATGPLAQRPGFDQIAQGYSGLMSVTGSLASGPTRVGVAIGDLTAGMWLAIGVLAAWASKGETGIGRTVETSLLSSLVSLLSVQGQRYLSLGEIAQPSGNQHPVIAPYGVFHASDGALNIAAATQDMWLRLCDVIGAPELAHDPRFRGNRERVQNRQQLHEIVEAALAARTRGEWTERLIAAGIPTGPINNIGEVIADEQVEHLGLVETVQHFRQGPVRQIANPLIMDGCSGGWIRRAPPVLGEHTREVLAEYGFADSRVAAWEQQGIVLQASADTKHDKAD